MEIGGKKFKNIPSNILKGATWIEDLSFDSAVKSIGRSAFENCTALTSIMFPSSLAQIGPAAFKGCTTIKELTLPEQLQSIGSEAFADTQLRSISFPSSLIHLEFKAFSGSSLENVSYNNKTNDVWVNTTFFRSPDSAVSLTGNQNLEELILLYGTTNIPENALAGCSNLRYVSVPATLTSLEFSAFDDCQKLTSVDYGNKIDVQDLLLDTVKNKNNIGKILFAGMQSLQGKYKNNSKLKKIHILNNVTCIPHSAFFGCSSLDSVIIPNSVTCIDSVAFDSCSSLPSITLPNSVISIGFYTFQSCFSLSSIVIPNSVSNIGNGAFRHCFALSSITIPGSISKIGSEAFHNCTSLKTINISKISLSTFNSIDWLSVFKNQSDLNRITKVICHQEQIEKAKKVFPNAIPEIVE